MDEYRSNEIRERREVNSPLEILGSIVAVVSPERRSHLVMAKHLNMRDGDHV
jgi:hypothetical protein